MKRFIPKVMVATALVMSVTMTDSSIVKGLTTVKSDMGLVTEATSVDLKSTNTSTNDKALENAINTVKLKVSIPKDYTEFDYDLYSSSNTEKVWTLIWRNPSKYDNIMVSIDQDLHIKGYHHNKYSEQKDGSNVAAYLKKELKETADQFIKTIAPEIASKLEYVDAVYQGTYNNSYNYQYVRKENGIKMPGNTVSVAINAATGEINNLDINWLYGVKVPSAKAKISQEKATEIIKENLKMKLQYHKNWQLSDKGNSSIKGFLLYEPDRSYISIDANTGEVYLTQNTWVDQEKSANEAAFTTDSKADYVDAGGLTKEEAVKVDELKNLLTQEEAVKKITSNSYLEFNKATVLASAELNKSTTSDGKTTYYWNLNFEDTRPIDYEKGDTYRTYIHGQVDASTGKILSYYTNLKSYFNEVTGEWKSVKVAYNKEQSKAVLEKFLKSQMNSKFEKTKLSSDQEDYVIYYKDNQPVYGGYGFNYVRVNDGIEYPYNNIYGAVNGVTGKIYRINTSWDESIMFESSKGAIAADKAMDYYLQKDGYELVYEINQLNEADKESYSKKVTSEIRLVYSPNVYPSYISPFTGEQMNGNGEVYKKTTSYQYKDIVESKETRGILLLADMEIGFEGDYFLPESKITKEELKSILDKIGYYYNLNIDLSKEGKSEIEREELAYYYISGLGLSNVAKLSNIYKTGYTDENIINSDYIGCVALAKGFGIMEGDGNNNFNPKNSVTRLETVNTLLKYISARFQINY